MARVLHISDLHLETLERAETCVYQLCSDIQRELGIETLDAIIVSGDNSEFAQPTEYKATAAFVKQLCETMHVASKNLLVVPGNHDVDWVSAKESYFVVRASEAPASSVSRYQDHGNRNYVEVVTDARAYERRFHNYAQYHRDVTGRAYPLEYSRQFEVVTSTDNKLVLLGLNSAWNLDHYYPNRSSIEATALNRGLVAARECASEVGSEPRIFAVWHHPIHGDGALQDTAFLQRLVVDEVVAVLHGHIHKPENEQFNYEWSTGGRKLWVLGAGTLDSPDVYSGYPWHYSLISIQEDHLEVRSRAKSERDGAWHSDGRYLVARGMPPDDVLRLPLTKSRQGSSVELGPAHDDRQSNLLRRVSDLTTRLNERQYNVIGYRIAVEAWIFDPNGRLLLQERGPACRDETGKFECIGGQVTGDDLIESLNSYVRKRLGESVRVEVDELLDEQPTRHVEVHGPEDWLVVSYLCRLIEGEPHAVESTKTAALRWVELAELHSIPDEDLSRSTSRARDVYRIRFRTNPYFSNAGRPA
jgi:3',5'-cyclic AMP phosphodiesterase CpdA